MKQTMFLIPQININKHIQTFQQINPPHEGRITDPASFTVIFASSGCDLFCSTCDLFLLSSSSKSCLNSTELSFEMVRKVDFLVSG
jgi:hypothetical protein